MAKETAKQEAVKYINRRTNIMGVQTVGEGRNKALYFYRKPMIENCKVTFADGSSYWQKTIHNDRFLKASTEPNTLYLDQECTLLADITRKQKIQECKKAGLI
ncbi:hypothetical protein COJ36_28440 [Priestia megaterium]|uniref:hypothetical protein n=1 Tax=Priestia megaterium TaxID=1404 RepID=UPI000BF56357|nr:hypothetical protein [Priestia megaterium]PFL59876.1 hypothetical protein COJ36_28440 [Priestia megaterium]